MKRVALILCALVLALVPASVAQAESGDFGAFSIIFGGPGVHVLDDTQLQVAVSGAVAVEYHGSEAAGCARMGLCDVSGTITWDPGRDGALEVEKYLQHGKHRLAGYLITRGKTAATVTRRTPGVAPAVCGDASEGLSGLASASSRSLAALSLRLVDTDVADFATSQCAGPLSQELVKLLPVRPLTRAVLDGKSTKVIDLSTTRPFSTGGFAGTLRSTVVVRVGPEVERPPGYDEDFKGLTEELKKHRKRYHELEARYEISTVAGKLAVAFRGASNLCADFDSCGASGTATFEPRGSRGELELDAYLPVHRPWRDLRTAFGLGHGGHLKGARILGYGDWSSSSGTVASTVAHADGGATCSDSVPVHEGSLYASLSGSRLALSYTFGGGFGDPGQTHCPGPLLGRLPLFQQEAQGSVPLSVLRKRTTILHLKLKPTYFSTPGYEGTTEQDLTVTLRRVGVRQGNRTLLY